MPPQPRRGLALVLLALLLAPAAGATHDPADPLHTSGSLPDLRATSEDPAPTDESVAPTLCGAVINYSPNAHVVTPFVVELRVDDVPLNATQVTEQVYAGSSVRLCWTLGEPLPRGVHRFTLVADAEGDVPESNETNNAAFDRWFGVSSFPRPDLRVKSLQVVPRVARPGSWQTAFITLENVGRADAPATAFDLLEDNVALATGELRELAVGRSVSYAFYLDPSTRKPGNYSLSVIADPLDVVAEANERNNLAQTSFEVPVRPLPDLALRDALVNGTLEARRGLRLDVALDNLGNATATRPEARLLMGNATLAEAARASLAPGANATLTFHFVLPAGNHTLRVVADPDGRLVESDDENNALTLDVRIRPAATDVAMPNLLVKRLDVNPTDPGPQEPVLLTALVRNAGEKTSNGTSVAFYADGKLLARKPLAPLKPESYATLVHAWGNHTRGDHDLRVVVDVQDAVAEADEHDNTFLAYVTLADPTPLRPPPTNATPVEVNETPEGNETPATPEPVETPPPEPPAVEAKLAIGELTVSTRPVPGGLKGVLVVSLRNPTLDELGRISVVFTVDGQLVKETVVNGMRAAGTATATSGEIDLPPGDHVVKAEARIIGADARVSTQAVYDKPAGERDTPAPGAFLALGCVGLAALLARRARRP